MLRSVAMLELAKGLLVLFVVLAFLSLSRHTRHNLDLEGVAENLLHALHVSRERHLSETILRAASRLGDANLVTVSIGAGMYSIMRFIESYGLWKQRIWAEWVALISGASYLPFEIYVLCRRASMAKLAVFLLNIVIVLYMAYLLIQNRNARRREQQRAAEEVPS